MKKVLVIGASGSLGQGVIKELGSSYNITGTYATREFLMDNVNSVKLDITNVEDFSSLEKDFDVVFLLAGAMPAMMKGYKPQTYIDVNITGILNVLEFCRLNDIPKLIYLQTVADVSSCFFTGIPIKNDQPRAFKFTGDHAIYTITKNTACDLIEHYHQEYGLQTIIFRIPTIYCNDNNFEYHVNGKIKRKDYVTMIESIIMDKRIEIWGNPKNSKDMHYIKDFARLIGKAIDSNNAQGFFNAGTGNPISLEELVNCMIEVFSPDEKVDKVYLPNMNSQRNFTFDMETTKETFSFNHEYGIKEMLVDIKKVFDDRVDL